MSRARGNDAQSGDAPGGDDARRAASWSRFWSSGAEHSCVGSWGARYGGAIAAFWRQAFAGLGAADVVLDLATGNGPLPRLLAEAHAADPARMPRVLAVDLADVVMPWRDALAPALAARIAVHPRVSATALPFADASVDLGCSQYGFEYVPREAALAELLRVLAPGGRAALVLHHAGSRLVEVAREEDAHLAVLLAPEGLLAQAAPMLAPMARAATPAGREALRGDAAANAARAALNRALEALGARAAASPVPDALLEAREQLPALFRLAAERGVAAAEAALAGWRQALEDARLRQRELIACALDEAALAALREAFAADGRASAATVLLRGEGGAGEVLGWGLTVAPRG